MTVGRYVVNSGRTHALHLNTELPYSPVGVLLVGQVSTLCGLSATQHMDVFSSDEVSCREWRRRRERADAQQTIVEEIRSRSRGPQAEQRRQAREQRRGTAS